jgi:hypothetical protein
MWPFQPSWGDVAGVDGYHLNQAKDEIRQRRPNITPYHERPESAARVLGCKKRIGRINGKSRRSVHIQTGKPVNIVERRRCAEWRANIFSCRGDQTRGISWYSFSEPENCGNVSSPLFESVSAPHLKRAWRDRRVWCTGTQAPVRARRLWHDVRRPGFVCSAICSTRL